MKVCCLIVVLLLLAGCEALYNEQGYSVIGYYNPNYDQAKSENQELTPYEAEYRLDREEQRQVFWGKFALSMDAISETERANTYQVQTPMNPRLQPLSSGPSNYNIGNSLAGINSELQEMNYQQQRQEFRQMLDQNAVRSGAAPLFGH